MIRAIVLFSVCYSIVISLIAHALYVPSEFTAYATDLTTTTAKTEQMFKGVMGVPLLDIGGLIFYTGNIIIDFLMNFVTALPSVASLLIDIFFRFFPVGSAVASTFKLGIYTLVSIVIVIYLVQTLLNIRARGSVV